MEIFYEDYMAYKNKPWHCIFWIDVLFSIPVRIMFLGRKSQFAKNKLSKKVYLLLLKKYSKKYGIEIFNFENIGKGIKLAHPYAITVNSRVKIGDYCCLFKGCTLGSIREGKKEGCPTIGNKVVIGLNSTVVGNIMIGNNVMIASNSFVNFDVPDNSIVIGNPGIIKKYDGNPTKMYID